jgi:hypothetical protein
VNLRGFLTTTVSVAAALVLTGCAAASGGTGTTTGPVIAPVVKNVNDLQGATVDLVVGQALDIDTGDLAVDSYTAKIDDPSVVDFVQGRKEASATFNPGLTALAAGSTTVVLTNAQGGIQPLTFTVDVAAK